MASSDTPKPGQKPGAKPGSGDGRQTGSNLPVPLQERLDAMDTGEAEDKPDTEPAKSRADQTAIALSYEIGGEHLPKVVATGRGKLAEDIIRLAFEAGVNVRQDADLAQLLVTLDLDSEIPTEALEAVAEILSYVYKANGKMAEMKEAAKAAAEAAETAEAEAERALAMQKIEKPVPSEKTETPEPNDKI